MKFLKGKTLYAYVAGIVDGEGTITLNAQTKRSIFCLRIEVCNTNEWLIQMLHNQFGGIIHFRKSTRIQCKNVWRWIIVSRKAAEFLSLILPYLQLKRPQGELALSFQGRRVASKRNKSNAVLDQADKILMLSLNKTGRGK